MTWPVEQPQSINGSPKQIDDLTFETTTINDSLTCTKPQSINDSLRHTDHLTCATDSHWISDNLKAQCWPNLWYSHNQYIMCHSMCTVKQMSICSLGRWGRGHEAGWQRHMHAQTHKDIHRDVYTDTQHKLCHTYTHTHTHTHTLSLVHTCTHTHTHARVHTHTHLAHSWCTSVGLGAEGGGQG